MWMSKLRCSILREGLTGQLFGAFYRSGEGSFCSLVFPLYLRSWEHAFCSSPTPSPPDLTATRQAPDRVTRQALDLTATRQALDLTATRQAPDYPDAADRLNYGFRVEMDWKGQGVMRLKGLDAL